jgi:hypothetical protein
MFSLFVGITAKPLLLFSKINDKMAPIQMGIRQRFHGVRGFFFCEEFDKGEASVAFASLFQRQPHGFQFAKRSEEFSDFLQYKWNQPKKEELRKFSRMWDTFLLAWNGTFLTISFVEAAFRFVSFLEVSTVLVLALPNCNSKEWPSNTFPYRNNS